DFECRFQNPQRSVRQPEREAWRHSPACTGPPTPTPGAGDVEPLPAAELCRGNGKHVLVLTSAHLLQSRSQPAIDSLEAVLSNEGKIYCEGMSNGFCEDGWDRWVTANFQIIFGALIPLKKISKKTCLDDVREDSQGVLTHFGMSKEKKTRMVKLEKHDPDTYPMIVGKVKTSIPKMRTVKLKEKFKVATSKSNSTSASVTTCETSGNIRKLCVNLMPFLAAAKEPAEEEEGNEEDKSSTSKNGPETSNKNEAPSVTKSVEQTLNSFIGLTLDTDTKQLVNPHFVLPPISQSKSAPECCDHQKNLAPQPPISLSEQTRTISSNFSIKCCGGGGLVTGQVADSRPWIDNPLFSKSRSPEFSLPDISLSSLDALLQTVTQKLGRKRRGFDEGSWGRIQSNHLLMAEYNRWSPNEGDGSGEFSLVASAVASSLPLSVLRQSQLLYAPLRHLKDSREGKGSFQSVMFDVI
ncbi:hypothetical protein FQN60_012806, partial [Etheostoma spectabile]